MKTINAKKMTGPAFQGDLMVTIVDSVPADAVATEDNVVAHSETGHHHVAENAQVYRGVDGMSLYLKALHSKEAVKNFIEITHKRPYDTHEPLKLLGKSDTVWKITRQREHTPEGWKRVED